MPTIQELVGLEPKSAEGRKPSCLELPLYKSSAVYCAPHMKLAPGTILGQYEIRSPLGAGGMGEVYRARDTRLDREVAIKVLPEFVSSDPDRLRRFEQEARAAAALNHPNILVVHQMGTYEGMPYLVSELLEGDTLRESLRRGPVGLRKAIDCGVQIAHGLAAAHDKGITHRDLKPENLFVARNGRVKILDFGLAKLTQVGAAPADGATVTVQERTDPGHVLGTVGYMSPEQVRGQAADRYDERDPERGTSLHFTACTGHASVITESRASLPGKESGAAVSVGFRFGFRTARVIGFGSLVIHRRDSG